MPDEWEVEHDLNPLVYDADEDADDDGFSNLEEYLNESDPSDASSHPVKVMPWVPLLLLDE